MPANYAVILGWLWVAVKVLTLAAIMYWGIVEARRFRRRYKEGRRSAGADLDEEAGPEEDGPDDDGGPDSP